MCFHPAAGPPVVLPSGRTKSFPLGVDVTSKPAQARFTVTVESEALADRLAALPTASIASAAGVTSLRILPNQSYVEVQQPQLFDLHGPSRPPPIQSDPPALLRPSRRFSS